MSTLAGRGRPPGWKESAAAKAAAEVHEVLELKGGSQKEAKTDPKSSDSDASKGLNPGLNPG